MIIQHRYQQMNLRRSTPCSPHGALSQSTFIFYSKIWLKSETKPLVASGLSIFTNTITAFISMCYLSSSATVLRNLSYSQCQNKSNNNLSLFKTLGLLLPSVLWNCWLGHLTCKNRPWNDL